MRRILRVGRESSEAMATKQEYEISKAKPGEVRVDCGKNLGGHVSRSIFWAVGTYVECDQGKMMQAGKWVGYLGRTKIQ